MTDFNAEKQAIKELKFAFFAKKIAVSLVFVQKSYACSTININATVS